MAQLFATGIYTTIWTLPFFAPIYAPTDTATKICIVLRSTPFEIAGTIVELVFVNMIDLRLMFRIVVWTKGFCYKAMETRLLALATTPQANMCVAGMLNYRGNDALWREPHSTGRSDALR